MKNRVDIAKLIDKKYNDNQFSLREFNELIDSVLSEKLDGYWGKVDTAELEENDLQGRQIANRVNGNTIPAEPEIGAPRHERPVEPGYGGREPSNVIPDKIAEADQTAPTKTQTVTIQIPDIFSMITNMQMDLGDPDRILIDKIVNNLGLEGKKNWIERIKTINQFIEQNTAQKPNANLDIRSSISNLIFLSVLKKMSFFVAQPGKLFEYVMAPIIGSGAKVVGSTDDDIIDVSRAASESGGEERGYSIKLFTGEQSNYNIVGSYNNLLAYNNSQKKPVTYIIAVSKSDKSTGIIQFSELLISAIPEHFSGEGWEILGEPLSNGNILINKTKNLFGIWISRNKYDKLDLTSQAKKRQQTSNISRVTFEMAGKNVQLGSLETTLSTLENKVSEIRQIASKGIEQASKKELESLMSNIKTIARNLFEFPDYKSRKDELLADYTLLVKETEQFISNAKSKIESIKKEASSLQEAEEPESKNISVLPSNKELNPDKFMIPIKGSWSNFSNLITLNLGNPKVFNQHQLTIANSLVAEISNTLNAYQQLNTNLLNYFATSAEQQQGIDHGEKAMQNAKVIYDNVSGFREKEKSSKK